MRKGRISLRRPPFAKATEGEGGGGEDGESVGTLVGVGGGKGEVGRIGASGRGMLGTGLGWLGKLDIS